MNDKYKDYFNDEGEFLIPFEAIQRGKRPRRIGKSRLSIMYLLLAVIGVMIIGVMCGFGVIVMLVTI